MLGCSEMFTMLWLAPAACLALKDIIAAHSSHHSSLAINQGLAASLPHILTKLLKSALQGHF